MKFGELNDKDKKDVLDCMCWLSARCNELNGDPFMVPDRTECEILGSMSVTSLKYWGCNKIYKIKNERCIK